MSESSHSRYGIRSQRVPDYEMSGRLQRDGMPIFGVPSTILSSLRTVLTASSLPAAMNPQINLAETSLKPPITFAGRVLTGALAGNGIAMDAAANENIRLWYRVDLVSARSGNRGRNNLTSFTRTSGW